MFWRVLRNKVYILVALKTCLKNRVKADWILAIDHWE